MVVDPPSAGDGGANAWVDRWMADARAKAERYREMRDQASQVSVTGSSPDGVVDVTVDSAGNVTELRVTDKAKEWSGAEIAAAVLDTIRRTQARLPERLAEVTTQTIGDEPDTVNAIVASYRAKFPEPDPEPGDPAPKPKRTDDNWSDESYLEQS